MRNPRAGSKRATDGGSELVPRRLALVVPGLELGGGVPAVARFLRDVALRSEQFDLRLVSLSVASKDPLSLQLSKPREWAQRPKVLESEWEGRPCFRVGAVAGELEFQRYRPRQILTSLLADCDLIQVVAGSPAWANAVCGLGKPVALHCATRAKVERRRRSARARGFSDWWRKGMTPITNLMDDRALRMADAIQLMNPWMLDYTRQLNSGREVDLRYAPPGVDATLFHPLPDHHATSDPYILCVGRLDDPRKRIEMLLQAYARLPGDLIAQVRLVLAGAAGPPPSFWRQAEAMGLRDRVSFLDRPERAALVSLYQHASVFALPSDEEGFGMVVIEAMACGIPVVSTRSGGPDGIISDGQDGFLVGLDDTENMAARLTQLLRDATLNREMGRQARRTIERRYDERVAGDVFLDIWQRMVPGAGVA